MSGDYQILASIHDEIHMGGFAQNMTGRLVDYAQRNNWMGRQITDVGCGTGESVRWLTQHGYIVTGIDKSSAMLEIAEHALQAQGMSARMIEADFRSVNDVNDQDMVICLNTLNELNNIRELEQAFQHLRGMLKQGKFFIFDMYTIEGLVMRNQDGYMLEHDSNGLTIFVGNNFDYEKSIQERNYMIFRDSGNGWQRQDAQRILRAYPSQGVTALVKRSGFDVKHVLNMDMSEHTPGDHTPRIIVLAEKQ